MNVRAGSGFSLALPMLVSLLAASDGSCQTEPAVMKILVADFVNSGGDLLPVSDCFLGWFVGVAAESGLVLVEPVEGKAGEPVGSPEAAVAAGREAGADAVVWGEYRASGAMVWANVNVELLTRVDDQFVSTGLEFEEEYRFSYSDLDTAAPPTAAARFLVGISLAAWLYDMERFDESISLCRSAISIGTTLPPSYQAIAQWILGFGYTRVCRFASAIDCFTRAFEMDASRPEYLTSRGTCLAQINEVEESIADFLLAAELYPDDAQANAKAGAQLNQVGRSTEALPYLERAVSIEPENAMMHRDLSRVYYKLGRFEEAMGELETAISLDPVNPEPYGIIGVMCYERRDFQRALEYLQQGLSLETRQLQQSWYHGMIGDVYIELGETELAEHELSTSIEMNPDEAYTYYYRARCRISLGNLEGAFEDLCVFLASSPLPDGSDEWMFEDAQAILSDLQQTGR